MSVIKSFSVGNGDMFYIKHHGDNFTIIDCCFDETNRASIVSELKSESTGKQVIRFISTHPDDDHIRGLSYLHAKMNLLNFYTVKNEATKELGSWTDDFDTYCQLRDDKTKAFYVARDCSRKWMNTADEERGSSGINIRWPIIANPHYKEALAWAAEGESPNNISPIVTYSLNDGAEIIWMGDLESDFQEKIQDAVILPSVDVLFAPHHGRDSGRVVTKWLDEMSPNLIIIGEAPSQHLCYYPDHYSITQNSAGDITLDCAGDKIHIYVSNEEYSVDFLENEYMSDAYCGYYLGTLITKAAKKKQKAAAAS